MKIRWTPPDFHDTVFAVQRAALQQRVNDLLRQFRVVALLGPRQSGKTTLVCPGDAVHELADNVQVRGLSRLVSEGKL